jgi:hypothetical protein
MLHIKNTVTPTFQHFDAIVKAFDQTARMPFEKIIGTRGQNGQFLVVLLGKGWKKIEGICSQVHFNLP